MNILFVLSISLLFDTQVLCVSRGGGDGGSPGSKINTGTIKSSSRYKSWTARVGLQSSTRYKYASWSSQHYAIFSGYIIMSSHQQSRFRIYEQYVYSSVSICYNEIEHYGRNVNASPWFMCPWNAPYERYCCGDVLSEKCCRYFDRTGTLLGLISGLFLWGGLCIYFGFYCRKKYKRRKAAKIVLKYEEQREADGDMLIYPLAPINSIPVGTNLPYPVYPETADNIKPYPTTINNQPQSIETDNSPPYPAYFPTTDIKLPFPVYPSSDQMPNPEGVRETNPTAPLYDNLQNQLPPSYEDALKL